MIKGHLGHGRARQEGATLAAHQHSAGGDAEAQLFLSGGKSEHKRNSWMAKKKKIKKIKIKAKKLDSRFSAAPRCSSGGS